MKVYRSNTLAILAVSALLIACGGSKGTKESKNATAPDSLKQDSLKTAAAAKPQKESLAIERKYDDIARFIGGLPQKPGSTIDASFTDNKAWKSYAEAADKSWKTYDSTRLSIMRDWSKSDLAEMNKTETNIFYPFSGPDILNAYTFFPHAKQFVMVGLEPVGSLPDLQNKHYQDSLPEYLHSINTSLYSILNFSFFRTRAMRVDLNKQNELNGTIHLLLLFLTRTGNTIAGISPVSIHHDGSIARYDNFSSMKKDSLKSKGVEIRFLDKDSTIKKVYFFSTNLANDGIKANPGFTAFVKEMGHYNTYLKSASCLMHENYFSGVRNLILDGSNYVLEDDSGIPYKYFVENGHYEFTFYGTYSWGYNIFHHNDQKDLMAAYKSGTNVKPLPFGIGYKFRKGESNLLLAKHKN
jgi:hypothetical protein